MGFTIEQREAHDEWIAFQHQYFAQLQYDVDKGMAYLAGLVDGEGCVSLYKRGGHYSLTLRIAQNAFLASVRLLEELALVHGGSVSESVGGRKLEYQVHGMAAAVLMTKLQPFIKLKSEEVALALRWWRSNLTTPDASYSDYVVSQLKALKRSWHK